MNTITTYFTGENDKFLGVVESSRGGLRKLVAELSPVAAATDRFNKQQALLDDALKRGRIELDAHAEAAKRLKQQYDTHIQSLGGVHKASVQTRGGMQQLSYQIGDVAQQFALGTPPMTIFVQQGGQVIQALQMMTSSSKGLLGFLGGPWGIAISAGAAVLVPLIANLFKTGETIDDLIKKKEKNRKETELNRKADEAWANTLDGLIDRIEKSVTAGREAIKGEGSDALKAREEFQKAQEEMLKLGAARDKLRAQLDASRARLGELRGSIGASDPRSGIPAIIRELEANIAKVQGDLAKAEAALSKAIESTRQKRAAALKAIADQGLDPLTKATNEYRDALRALDEQFTDPKKRASDPEYIRRYREITATFDAAKKAAQEAARETRTAQQVFKDFEAELAKRGVQHAAGVYGHRTAEEQNRQFREGASPLDGYKRRSRHQSWQAFDPSRASEDDQAAYAAAQAAGLKGFRIVNESGGRKHYEWTGAGKPGEVDVSSSEREAKSAEALRNEELARARAYYNELASARASLLGAQRKEADTAGERRDMAVQAAREELLAYKKKYDIDLAAGKLKQDEYDALIETRQAAYDAKKAAANRALTEDALNTVAKNLQRVREAEYENEAAALRGQLEMADTLEERQKIQLQILELERKHALAAAKITAQTEEEYKLLAAGIEARFERDSASVRRDTMGPIGRYMSELHRGAAAINEDFEHIAVDGLRSLNDGLADAVMGTRSLGDVFKNVANQIIGDLLRIAIQQTLIKPLADSLFGGVQGQANSMLGGGGGFSFGSFFSGLFGGGGGGSSGLQGIVNGFGNLPRLAGGGSFIVPGSGNLDSELLRVGRRGVAMVAPGEKVTVTPANDRGSARQPVVVQLVVGPGEVFEPAVRAISGDVSVQTVRRAMGAQAQLAKQALA